MCKMQQDYNFLLILQFPDFIINDNILSRELNIISFKSLIFYIS